MSFQRRRFLQILSYAFGSSFILPKHELAIAAQNPTQRPSSAPPAKMAAEEESKGAKMERVGSHNKLSGIYAFEENDAIAIAGEFRGGKLAGVFRSEGVDGKWEAVRTASRP